MSKQVTPFLLLAKARTISLKDVFTMGEDAAYDVFRKLRWPDTNGEAVCPRCGHGESYNLKKRRQFQCKSCKHQFSVSSGTIFSNRKLTYTDLLAAIVLVVNSAKGISALQLARDLNHQHKSMWVLMHKIREALAAESADLVLSGVCEIDGMWNGGHSKPENRVEDRKDRRLKENQTGKRRSVIAVREKQGRTKTTVVPHESDGVPFVSEAVQPGTVIHADEGQHWNALHSKFPMGRVNHSECYSENGICTNMVESYFSRLRRMIRGSHHHVSPKHLAAYAAHAAWLEDHRKEDNGKLTKRVAGLVMQQGVSRQWAGYWQRAEK